MDDKLTEKVEKNEYGFYQLQDKYRKPMKEFYEDEYYQQDYSVYSKKEYDEIDEEYRGNVFAQKAAILKKMGACPAGDKSMLDVGCGEGYALAYFAKEGWDVCGIDLSSYGLRMHNPGMEPYLRLGDFEKVMDDLQSEGRAFDFVNADYVFEHLPEPEKLVCSLKKVMAEKAVVSVSVPNDFSVMQCAAYGMRQIDSAFWVTDQTSEHINYFSVPSLTRMFEANGFEKVMAIADWPIDFFLLNPESNYKRDGSKAHDCHVACLTLENEIFRNSMDNAVELHRAIAEAGIGRAITVFYRKAQK